MQELQYIIYKLLDETTNTDVVRNNAASYLGTDFVKVASDDDLMLMIDLRNQYVEIRNKLSPILTKINDIRRKYKLSKMIDV